MNKRFVEVEVVKRRGRVQEGEVLSGVVLPRGMLERESPHLRVPLSVGQLSMMIPCPWFPWA